MQCVLTLSSLHTITNSSAVARVGEEGRHDMIPEQLCHFCLPWSCMEVSWQTKYIRGGPCKRGCNKMIIPTIKLKHITHSNFIKFKNCHVYICIPALIGILKSLQSDWLISSGAKIQPAKYQNGINRNAIPHPSTVDHVLIVCNVITLMIPFLHT